MTTSTKTRSVPALLPRTIELEEPDPDQALLEILADLWAIANWEGCPENVSEYIDQRAIRRLVRLTDSKWQ